MNEQEWKALREKANRLSDEEYSIEASNILKLTKSEIDSIISSLDKEKLSELIEIVKDTEKSNNEKANSIKNSLELVETAVALIGKFI